MSDPARKLQLTESHEPRRGFDRFAWLCNLRLHGLLAVLKPAETKVIFAMLSHANSHGIAWPSRPTLAEATGLTEDAVKRARRSLQDRGLLQSTRRPAEADRAGLAFALIDPGLCDPGGCASPPPGDTHPADGGHTSPRSKTPKQDNEAAAPESDHNGEAATEGHDRSELFEGKPRDAAAADLLIEQVGMAPKVANGLVTQYQPTAQQIRNVLTNAEARNQAYQQGEVNQPVKNLVAFVRAAIKRGEYTLDQRVVDQQRAAERDQQRQAEREREAQAREAQQQAEADKARRYARAVERYEQLTAEQWQRWYQTLIEKTPVVAQLSKTSPRIKDWIIDLMVEHDAR